jgi:hypothetical protein
MALIVETGAIVPGADSYVSLAEARTTAAFYGWALPTLDADAEIALRNGANYVGLFESEMKGSRVSAEQSLAYPRKDATVFGFDIPETSIPGRLQIAQIAAAVEIGAGLDPRASTDGRVISSEQVTGAVAVSYFNNGNTGATVRITKAIDALKPLLSSNNNGISFNVVRG